MNMYIWGVQRGVTVPEKMEGRRLGKFISEVGKLEGNEGQRWKFQS